MKTNLNIANSLNAEKNSYYVSEIEEETYCFTKTGKLKYIDFYDTHKSGVLGHLHLNANLIINKVAGFKSMTKTFSTLPKDYGTSKYVEIEENGDVYVLIHKYVVKEGAEEMFKKEMNHAWKNNAGFSAEHFMIRVD